MVLCPECESDLDIDDDEVAEGEVVACVECGTEFEVVNADPLELAAIRGAADDEEELLDVDEERE